MWRVVRRPHLLLVLLVIGAVGVAAAVGLTGHSATDHAAVTAASQAAAGEVPGPTVELPAYVPDVMRAAPPVSAAEQDEVYARAAREAWAYVDRQYVEATGLAKAQRDWNFPTLWDIGSTIGAYHAARELGFIDQSEYRRRVGRLLETLSRAPLYEGAAYGRNYDARTGAMTGHDQKPTRTGTGFSALDLGRLLAWLRIVAQDERLEDLASRVARRIEPDSVVRDGYLHGESVTEAGEVLAFQEGRLGYEQYAATAFAHWGIKAENALRPELNMRPDTVLDIPVTADKRGLDRLTSEPFILSGLEFGWTPALRDMAVQALAAQAARYERTGTITIASEDAVGVPPYYFYYYCVLCSGKPFTINVHRPGTELDEPRWVSTKAAFAWHALLPSDYTWRAVQAVQPALEPGDGWSSGVYEGTRKSTGTLSLNTAAVILEAAAYRKTGKPFLR